MAETHSIECRNCGVSFDAPNRRRKVCSRSCTLAAYAAKQKLEPKRSRPRFNASSEKSCGYCGVTKPGDQFYRQSHHLSGLSYGCKPCSASASKDRIERNRGAYLANRRRYYLDNREKLASDSQKRYWANYAQARERAWRVSHGINFTWEEYVAMNDSQGGRCAICDRLETSLPKNLAVDHNHANGKVRGLLCDDCNIALGRLRDDPVLLLRAAEYLTV